MIQETLSEYCEYCKVGWPFQNRITLKQDKRHAYPKDYKGMRAGLGPHCITDGVRL